LIATGSIATSQLSAAVSCRVMRSMRPNRPLNAFVVMVVG
jgi:hypothetical protein